MLNGSPHEYGNTAIALEEMVKVFEKEGIEVELLHIGAMNIRGCIGCQSCYKTGRCVFDDAVNEIAPKLEAADGEQVYIQTHVGIGYRMMKISE
jgi:multimeric flavodoxin WrbA